MALLNLSGKIVMLRVNEVGDSFGKPPDNFVVEVVVQLDSHAAGAASGFQLRADGNQPARQGMMSCRGVSLTTPPPSASNFSSRALALAGSRSQITAPTPLMRLVSSRTCALRSAP